MPKLSAHYHNKQQNRICLKVLLPTYGSNIVNASIRGTTTVSITKDKDNSQRICVHGKWFVVVVFNSQRSQYGDRSPIFNTVLLS